jgi:hypothetical protein
MYSTAVPSSDLNSRPSLPRLGDTAGEEKEDNQGRYGGVAGLLRGLAGQVGWRNPRIADAKAGLIARLRNPGPVLCRAPFQWLHAVCVCRPGVGRMAVSRARPSPHLHLGVRACTRQDQTRGKTRWVCLAVPQGCLQVVEALAVWRCLSQHASKSTNTATAGRLLPVPARVAVRTEALCWSVERIGSFMSGLDSVQVIVLLACSIQRVPE